MKSFQTIGRKAAALVIERERNVEQGYRKILEEVRSHEDRAILRDIILQKEMNELLLRNMFNL